MNVLNAFQSGTYRTWFIIRHVGVAANKACRRIHVRGLGNALASGRTTQTHVILNGVSLGERDYVFDRARDRIVLARPLADGNYQLHIRFQFDDLEPVQYW